MVTEDQTADAAVVRLQEAQDTGDIRWRRLDASGPAASVASAAAAPLEGIAPS